MLIRPVFRLALLAQLSLAPSMLSAQIQTKKVSFAAGKSSTTLSGTIKGENTIDYLVNAKEGQQMSVTLNSKHSALYFNVLPPGSNGEAIFIGSTEGNKFNGALPAAGEYKIRVFLYRSAARRNESASYTMALSITGAGSSDAKVPGTNYHATGQLPAAVGTGKRGSMTADFGVIRGGNGSAEIHIKAKGGFQHKLRFAAGEWSCASDGCKKVKYTKNADEWELIVNDYEHYFINDAVITGG